MFSVLSYTVPVLNSETGIDLVLIVVWVIVIVGVFSILSRSIRGE